MDILLFGHLTAEESIAHTQKVIEKLKTNEKVRTDWETVQEMFVTRVVPALKARAQELRQGPVTNNGPCPSKRACNAVRFNTSMIETRGFPIIK